MLILIADSGSTKTDWMLCDCDGYRQPLQTAGFNPFFQTEQEIAGRLKTELNAIGQRPERIFFYGAGCIKGEPCERMERALLSLFPAAAAEVESDLLGAARAVCGTGAGIACILGTGSNSCFYDGREIAQQVSPLGFILGDEGSGAHLGKTLTADLLKNQLSESLKQKFFERFGLSQTEIIRRVYSEPYPNRFLASLSVFIRENSSDPAIRTLLNRCFGDFFTRNVFQYDYRNYPVHLCGSVAYHYETEIRETAARLSVNVGRILRTPIAALTDYHLNER